MKKSPKLYLLDIEQAISAIRGYVEGITKEQFQNEKFLIQDGVIRKISIIGEAVKRLSPSMKDLEKHIPWKKIAGMRDIVVHDYSEIDLNAVWVVVQKRLPELDAAVKRLLKSAE
ncbi:MAG: DUF86 domain-containing protein [Candidatus Uhrbacteria bacterium]|nr:DUF86 domain-containing protein [Candidatus Uhrbacteria bacterium]